MDDRPDKPPSPANYDPEVDENANPICKASISMSRELAVMMTAFGDAQQPAEESVQLMEQIVHKFLADTTAEVMRIEQSDKLSLEGIMYCFRNDPAKLERTNKLIEEKRNLKQFRRAFDPDDFP